MKLLRIILRIHKDTSKFEIIEYEILSTTEDNYIIRCEDSVRMSRRAAKKALMRPIEMLDQPSDMSVHMWCHDGDEDSAKDLMKDFLLKEIRRKADFHERMLTKYQEKLQSIPDNKETTKRMTFEQLNS